MAKVLIVEDIGLIRNNLQNFIAKSGYEAITAKDGMEALDTLAAG